MRTETSTTKPVDYQAARDANRDPKGCIINRALDLRLQAQERAAAIEALGWAPENGDPYAATTGEMLRWAEEDAK